jgi:uncharacterized membrane protein
MDALSEAIVRLIRRHDESDRRLARIETALGIGVPPPEPEVMQREREPEPPPAPIERAPELPSLVQISTEAHDGAPPPQPSVPGPAPDSGRPRELETQVGLTWISRIGAITLIFCVAFVFKYAVDNQWIGETGRIALGILAGLACLGIGDRIWRAGHQTYAQAVCGLGIAVLYLSFYASFAYYHLLAQSVAFALMALTTAFSGALALHYNAPAIAALGLIGGYLTPILLSTGEDRPVIFFGYILLLDAGAMALAQVRRWLKFEFLAFGATTVLYFAWLTTHFTPEKQTVGAVFALLFYALFLIADHPEILIAVQVLATAALAAVWKSNAVPYLAASTAMAAAGLVVADIRKRAALAPVALGAFWVLYASWYSSFPGEPALGTTLAFLTAAFLLFFVWPPWRTQARNAELQAPELLVLSLNAVAYYGAVYKLLAVDYHAYLGLFTVALGALYVALGVELWRQAPAERRDERPVLLTLGVALTLITLAAPIQFTAYRITIGWAVEAAALTWIGKRTRSERLIFAAFFIFLLLVLRLWIIDSWIYATPDYTALWNARFLTFLVAAAALWAAAYWAGAGTRALVMYVAGHVILLWALMLEVTGWAERTAAPQNLANLESTAISVLMAVYALALIAAGVLSRTFINRVLGLGLVGLVVAKLYLYDVWLLVRIYRIAAFGLLGGLLLITSYVYSRYREKIEAWWSDEHPSV